MLCVYIFLPGLEFLESIRILKAHKENATLLTLFHVLGACFRSKYTSVLACIPWSPLKSLIPMQCYFFLQVLITLKEYYSLLYKGFDLKLSNKIPWMTQ